MNHFIVAEVSGTPGPIVVDDTVVIIMSVAG